MNQRLLCVVLMAAALLCAVGRATAVVLLGTFEPEIGDLNGLGFDPVSDLIYVHAEFDSDIHIYSRSGVLKGTVPDPGDRGNDSDIEFADEAININGTLVPANSLLAIENDSSPPRLIAANKSTGTVLATTVMDLRAIGQLTGGAFHHDRNTFFVIDWLSDSVHEVNPSTGVIVNTFDVNNIGPVSWDAFFSDLDVSRETGYLYLVSDSQNTIRVVTATGVWVEDIDVDPLGVSQMSGIGFDDVRGELWISGESTPSLQKSWSLRQCPECVEAVQD